MKLVRFVSVGALSMLAIAACGSDDDATSVPSDDAASAVTAPAEEAVPADTAATEGLDDLYPSETPPAESSPAGSLPAEATAGAPADGAGLQLLDTALGTVVGDAEGFTVYLFTPDEQGDSTCYDDCESNWPIVAEVTAVGEGLDASLLGTTERTTGETQATYNGWPLYSFSGDATAGDTNGQGVGGVWYAIDATGTAIED